MKRFSLITTPDALRDFCTELAETARVAFDTEFVPEYTYAPALCLIQVATEKGLAVLDPLALDDLEPFWTLLLDPGREVIVHAGKEEMSFCLARTGALPPKLFDVQLAAGFAGYGYPASYSTLVQRVLDAHPRSGETRTDWRKRPLSDKQLEYALDDVRYLFALREQLGERLESLGRMEWLEAELATFRTNLQTASLGERFRRIAGAGSLSGRQLAVLRELVAWRDARARALNKPARWILRDDLLTELAKRQPASLNELTHTRGIGNVASAGWAAELLSAIRRGQEVPEEGLPERPAQRETPEQQMVLKILSAAMIHLAQANHVANGLLGSNEDLRQLMEACRGDDAATERPRLTEGWRAAVCGDYLRRLLAGETTFRIQARRGNYHLIFEPACEPTTKPETAKAPLAPRRKRSSRRTNRRSNRSTPDPD